MYIRGNLKTIAYNNHDAVKHAYSKHEYNVFTFTADCVSFPVYLKDSIQIKQITFITNWNWEVRKYDPYISDKKLLICKELT